MEILFIIGFIVVVCVGYWIWDKITSAASAGINKRVFNRSAHAKGQALQSGPLLFHTRGPKEQVRQWVLGQLDISETRPKIGAGLTIQGVDGDTTRFAIGSSLGGDIAVFDLDLEQHGQTTTGTVTLLTWQESDGVMSAAGQLERIYDTICQSVAGADAQATVNSPLRDLR